MGTEPGLEATMTCGCRITHEADASGAYGIAFCPLHAAAPKLLAALEELLPWIERGRERFDREEARVLTQAIAAIREAAGQS
jgi:hypothetical protein